MVPTTPTPLIAREYLRVSYDRWGNQQSQAEQHAEHVPIADANGWQLGEPYGDTGSASRYARKPRGNFDRLLADLRDDRFGAQVLIIWESSRGSRRVGEWVALVDLCEQRRVHIYVTTHRRMYDPSVPRDRRALLEDAVDSEYESGKTSDRVTRNHASRAAAGKPAGAVPFGYRREHDPTTGRLLGRVPEPAEAALVREAFDRFTAGASLRSIVQHWRDRGVRNRAGRPFTPVALRELLRNRSYIAERVHIPGQNTRWWLARDAAQITPAEWEPIVDRATFATAQAILDDPQRLTRRPGGARHLLSMIARCDVCSGPLSARVQRGRATYRCHVSGCVTVPQADLDALAERVIVAWLAAPEVYEALRHGDEVAGDELSQVETRLAEARAELEDLAARVSAGELSVAFAARVEPGLQAKVDELSARHRELSAPPVLRSLIEPGEDVAGRWDAIDDPAARRKIAEVVLSSGHVGELRVRRVGARGVPVRDRVTFAHVSE